MPKTILGVDVKRVGHLAIRAACPADLNRAGQPLGEDQSKWPRLVSFYSYNRDESAAIPVDPYVPPDGVTPKGVAAFQGRWHIITSPQGRDVPIDFIPRPEKRQRRRKGEPPVEKPKPPTRKVYLWWTAPFYALTSDGSIFRGSVAFYPSPGTAFPPNISALEIREALDHFYARARRVWVSAHNDLDVLWQARLKHALSRSKQEFDSTKDEADPKKKAQKTLPAIIDRLQVAEWLLQEADRLYLCAGLPAPSADMVTVEPDEGDD